MFDFLKKKSSFEQGFLSGMVDRHSHILPCVDDGVRSMKESLDILAFQESIGVSDMWCTSHIMEDVPNKTEKLQAKFDELVKAYKGPVRLHLGAEYMMDPLFEERLQKKDLLVGDDGYLLVETSTMYAPVNLAEMLQDVMDAGYNPLFAHPERYRYLSLEDYKPLWESGVHFQLNYPSLTGFYGDTVRKKALYILKQGWYSAAGSDCHSYRTLRSQCSKQVLESDLKLFKSFIR